MNVAIDPLYQTNGKCFLYYGLLISVLISSFLICKFTDGKLRSLVLVISSALLGFIGFEAITEMINNSLFTYINLMYLLPLLCIMLNEAEFKKSILLGVEGSMCSYILVRAIVVNYLENRQYPLFITISFILYYSAVLIQFTLSSDKRKEELNEKINKLEKVLSLSDSQLPWTHI